MSCTGADVTGPTPRVGTLGSRRTILGTGHRSLVPPTGAGLMCPMSCRHPLHCIVPPSVLMRVAREGSDEEREAALQTLSIDHTLRQRRAEESVRLVAAPGALRPLAHQGGHPQRSIYDQESSQAQRLGKLVRGEGQPPTHDEAINEAYDGFGDTYKFYWDVFGRDSIDDRGMPILGL